MAGTGYSARSQRGHQGSAGEFSQDAQFKTRFEREARTIFQLNHPHICTLYDVGDNYLVMELLEGETLADRLQRGPLPFDQVLRYGIEIAEALEKAHKAGVMHRDLKLSNIMITKARAKLLDFGLACYASRTIRLSNCRRSLMSSSVSWRRSSAARSGG